MFSQCLFSWSVVVHVWGSQIWKKEKKFIKTHEKKLKNLTKNHNTPFKADEIIRNLSSYKLNNEESELLKFGLSYAIQPRSIDKTDVFSTFESICRVMKNDLKDNGKEHEIKNQISYLATSYVKNYRPTEQALRKHKILKKTEM